MGKAPASQTFVLMGVLMLASVGGCGAPSSLELCLADCAAAQRCLAFGAEELAPCQKGCQGQADALAARDRAEDEQCRNAAEIRRTSMECLQEDCTRITPCGAAIDRRCQPR